MKIQGNILVEVGNEDIIGGMLVLPEGVKSIGYRAFSCCILLNKVIFSLSLNYIENYAFQYCTNLKEIVLPEGLKSIGYGAFRGCSSLTHVVLPETLREIGWGAFNDCTNLNDVQGSNRELVNEVRLQAFIGRTPPSEKMMEWSKLATKN